MSKKNKKPKTAMPVSAANKVPRSQELSPINEGSCPAWRFRYADKGGPFAWPFDTDPTHTWLIQALVNFEQLNWSMLGQRGCHTIDLDKLSPDAQKRLEEIKQDDRDNLFSLRIEGKIRIWCIREGNIYYILWWDPEHKVYPTPPDKNDRKKIRNRQ